MVSALLGHALDKGIDADSDYVLLDSWSMQAPLMKSINDKGLFVIGMVKQLKQFYVYSGKRLTLPKLYAKTKPIIGKKDILGAIQVTLDNGIPAKILFIRNRNECSEWLVILSTNTTLDNEEIMRIYDMRRDIEFVPDPVCWTEAPKTLAFFEINVDSKECSKAYGNINK